MQPKTTVLMSPGLHWGCLSVEKVGYNGMGWLVVVDSILADK